MLWGQKYSQESKNKEQWCTHDILKLNWKTGTTPKNTTSESDTWVRLFTAHLEPKVLACLMSLTLEERDALQYENKVWFTPKLSSPLSFRTVRGQIRSYCNERSRLIRPTDKCFLRTPQSSDGLQPRDEGIHGEPSVPGYSMHMRAMQLVTDAWNPKERRKCSQTPW